MSQTRTSQIRTVPLAGGTASVWYQAAAIGAGITLLHVSDQWAVWMEYSDLRQAHDAKVFARPLTGGPTIQIDDSTTHGTLVALEDTALDRAEVYWTEPVLDGSTWHGRLMHRHLPDGQAQIAVQAPLGSVIGWPSVVAGTLAYELSSQTAKPQTRVVIQVGTVSLDVAAPSSEPSLGDGLVAYKAAERYEQGDVAAMRLADRSVLPLGPGEAPSAGGAYVTWVLSRPGGGSLRVARPGVGCNDAIRADPQSRMSFPSTDGQTLAWVYQDTDRPGTEATRIRYGSLLPKVDAPCSGP